MSERIFAIGDVHGCFDTLRELVESAIQLNKADMLILLGDYIDRGSQSKLVLDYLIWLLNEGYNIIPLKGNHEAMLTDAIKDNYYLWIWLYNGGDATLYSFNIHSVNELESSYVDFLKGLPLYYQLGDFYFVHAGFNEEFDTPFEDEEYMLWNCREDYQTSLFSNKTIVHGHCPIRLSSLKRAIMENCKVVDVDTGCVFSGSKGYGYLTAVELNSMSLYSVAKI